MSQDSSPFYRVALKDDVAIVTVLDPELLCDQRETFYALADSLGSNAECQDVVLSLEHVRVFKSTMLGVMINYQKRLKDQTKGLKLCQVDPDVLRVFQLTKMDQIFDIQPSESDAIRAIHSKPSKGWISKVFGGFGKSQN